MTMGAHAYASSNVLTGLAASAYTWSNGATSNRSYLNDGRMDRREVVGASVASGVNVIIDLGSAQQLVGFAVLNSNCAVQKTNATLLVEASSSATFAADVNVAKAASTLYSTLAPRNRDHVAQFVANFTKRYWRLTWTWTGNVTNFSIGELFAYAAVTQLSRRTIYGSGEGKKMYTAGDQFQTGERRGIKLGGPQRVLELRWSDLSVTQRDEIDAMWAAGSADVGTLLWIDSYEATAVAAATDEQNCVFGRFEQSELVFPEDDKSLYGTGGVNLTLRSAGREVGA